MFYKMSLSVLAVLAALSTAKAEIQAGDWLSCSDEILETSALVRADQNTPTFGPLSQPQSASGALICGIAPGAVLRVIERADDHLLVELKRGRVNMVTAVNGGAIRDFDHQYFSVPQSNGTTLTGNCEKFLITP